MTAYLQIEGIKGESQDEGHKGWVILQSAQYGIQRTITGNGSGSSRHRTAAKFSEFVCMKDLDCSSPKIARAAADGRSIPQVLIHFCTSSEMGKRHTYLEYELTNAIITSYSFSGSGDLVPMESLVFNYEGIKETYEQLGKDNKSQGKLHFGWKVEEGVGT